jgi:hypothetical protein
MTTASADKLPTMTTTSAPTSAYSECGAGGPRQLTISFTPSTVEMIVDRRTIALQAETWEYCFASDTPLELQFVSEVPCLGFVRPLGSAAMTSLTGLDGVLHFTCARPAIDGEDQQYEFVFTRQTTSGSTVRPPVDRPPLPPPAAGHPGKPLDIEATSAQPTLIIRTKKSCPTGVSNPTIEA